MATWTGSARTNYFRVNDEVAFREWAGKLGLQVIESDDPKPDPERLLPDEGKLVGLLEINGEGWPSFSYDEDTDEETEIDMAEEISGFLKEDEVAVIQEVGAEKLRYITGFSMAVNHKGEILYVGLDQIYKKIEDAGWPKPTDVSY